MWLARPYLTPYAASKAAAWSYTNQLWFHLRERGIQVLGLHVYLASLLHDLGLSEDHAADKRFEGDGADAASRFLHAHDYPETKIDIVWDAIALHSAADIADRREPEIALVHFGAHVDVIGLRMDEISPQLIDDALALYPRLGFKKAFTEALAEVARQKPHIAIETAGFGEPEAVIGLDCEAVVPNSMMREVVNSGEPILLDILETDRDPIVQAVCCASMSGQAMCESFATRWNARHSCRRRNRSTPARWHVSSATAAAACTAMNPGKQGLKRAVCRWREVPAEAGSTSRATKTRCASSNEAI